MFGWLVRELGGLWRSLRYDATRPVPLSRRRTEVLHPEYDAYRPRPARGRRYLAAGGLLVAGFVFVGGAYAAIASGLGGVLSPRAASVPPVATATGPAPKGSAEAPVTAPVPATSHSVRPSRRPAAVVATAAPVAAPSCLCPVPPVPTPEASSSSPSHSPSPSPSPSVTATPSADNSGQP